MESRALSLTPAVRRTIKSQCIPYAYNGLMRTAYKTEEAFGAKLVKQGLGGANIMYLCTADGKFLGYYQNRDLETPLAAWAKLPASERKPGAIVVEDRGPPQPAVWAPEPPEGGLVLKAYCRALDRDKSDRLFAPATLSLGSSKTEIPAEPNRDFLWLTREEWQGLLPAKLQVGETLSVPASVRARIAQYHLVDGACCLPGFWPREAMKECSLQASVVEVTAKEARLNLRGHARFQTKEGVVEFDLAGVLVCHLTDRTIRQLDLLGLSRTPIHKDVSSGRPLTLGIAFELGRADRPADRRPPFALWRRDEASRYFQASLPKP